MPALRICSGSTINLMLDHMQWATDHSAPLCRGQVARFTAVGLSTGLLLLLLTELHDVSRERRGRRCDLQPVTRCRFLRSCHDGEPCSLQP